MRKLICLIMFVSCLFSFDKVFSQSIKPKSKRTITVIFDNVKANCGYKALKVTERNIVIDNCYNSKTKAFHATKNATINQDPLYLQIFNTTKLQWETIQQDINNQNCDGLMPILIQLDENDSTYNFSLTRITNCYPKSGKEIMEQLELYFTNLK